MGICFSSASVDQSPPQSTNQFSSVATTRSMMTSSSGGSSSTISAGSCGGSFSPAGQMLAQPNLRVFTLAELKAATRNFRSDSVLGEGGFGKVYKGLVEDRATDRRKLKRIIDARLEGYPSKSVHHVAQLALHCLESEPKNRPSMQEIVERLEKIGSSSERPRERRAQSGSPHAVSHRGPQPLQYRSPLHPKPEATESYPLPQRS
ncbi:hypothetical protein SASPL_129038 [Salvia splendens]|uniref:Protein kinase domain-containing protein n=1 Tax=Salvia splendens TaxID=180675 RepID=A0A8X8XCE3_SALSN|nr:hypothetical protein SASPL_129038 [Salvia splendens]